MNGHKANELVGGSPAAAPAKEDSTVDEMCLSNYDTYAQLQGNIGMAAPRKKAVKPTEEMR